MYSPPFTFDIFNHLQIWTRYHIITIVVVYATTFFIGLASAAIFSFRTPRGHRPSSPRLASTMKSRAVHIRTGSKSITLLSVARHVPATQALRLQHLAD